MLKRRLKEPFGKAGLTVAIFALVLAMVGGAYAAGALSGKQKKEVEKIAKKFAGKPGAAGATGPAGVAGGAGAKGDTGTNGTNGTNGSNGKSVVTTAITTAGLEGHCVGTGGTRFQVEGSGTKEFVCNGAGGGGGGLPEFLEAGETETGVVGGQVNPGLSEGGILAAITFAIPLEAGLGEAAVHFVTEEEQTMHTAPSQCPGTANSPEAEEGNLCVYVGKTFPSNEEGRTFWTIVPASTFEGFNEKGTTGISGAFLHLFLELPTEGGAEFQASWAVTG